MSLTEFTSPHIFLEILFTPLPVLRSSPLPRILIFSQTLIRFLKHLTFQHKALSTSRLSFLQLIFMYKPKCHYARPFRFFVVRCVINVKLNSRNGEIFRKILFAYPYVSRGYEMSYFFFFGKVSAKCVKGFIDSE